jgi:hypothetical protein
MGGLSSNVFDASQEFTTLPIRFGHMYKTTYATIPSGVWIDITAYDAGQNGGIAPDLVNGILRFTGLPLTAWVQIYAWMSWAATVTGTRFGQIMDLASNTRLIASLMGMAGAINTIAGTWCSLPTSVAALTAGVRLQVFQNSGGDLALTGAALWAKRIQ